MFSTLQDSSKQKNVKVRITFDNQYLCLYDGIDTKLTLKMDLNEQ